MSYSIDTNSTIRLIRHGHGNSFVLPEAQSPPEQSDFQLCLLAQKLKDFTDKVCTEAIQNPSHVLLNQTKIKVLDLYFTLYLSAPVQHRTVGVTHNIRKSNNTSSNRNGPANGPKANSGSKSTRHVCLFEVFIDAVNALRECELTLSPPQLYLPTPPPPPLPPAPPRELPGVFLGELEDE
jgi:hypothetical protein